MSKSKLSILVADNSRPSFERIKTSLISDKNMKYKIDAAESSKDALEKASEDKIDLVLVNQKSSGTDGIKMLQDIIKKKLGVPVIMIVAEGDVSALSRETERKRTTETLRSASDPRDLTMKISVH